MIQHGITITDIYDKDLITKLKTLKVRPWARLVIDTLNTDYNKAAIEIVQYADLVVQVQDSFIDATTALEEYQTRCGWIKENLLWLASYIEISNEPNGSWCGPNTIAKMKYGTHYFGTDKTFTTVFVQPGYMEWWNRVKSAGMQMRLSFYPEKITDIAKHKALGSWFPISECGLENMPDGDTKTVMRLVNGLETSVCWWDWQKEWEDWNEVFGS